VHFTVLTLLQADWYKNYSNNMKLNKHTKIRIKKNDCNILTG